MCSFIVFTRISQVRFTHVRGTYFKLLISAVVNLAVVFVISLIEESLIPLVAVWSMGRSRHVVLSWISLLLALSGCNRNLGPLIEAAPGKNNDLVVEQGAEDEDNEAWNGLPLEWFEIKSDATSPD